MAISFGYGFASHAWDLFPKNYVQQAWRQAYWLNRDDDSELLTSRVYDRNGVRQVDPEDMHPGMTLVVSSWEEEDTGDLRPGAKLIDEGGEVVHSWKPDRNELFPDPTGFINTNPNKEDFHGSYLLPDGDLVVVLHYIGAARIDACGNVVWRLEEGNHHSVARADDGSFWIPGTSSERRTGTSKYPDGFPGIEKEIWIDQILNVTSKGTVVKRINVLDILYENGLERHLVKSLSPYPEEVFGDDPVHINDVEPLSSTIADEYPLFDAGDLLVSLRHPSLVFVFEPETGNVKWHASEPIIHQHDPDFIGNGWIGIFDNNTDLIGRGKMLGGSRIALMRNSAHSPNPQSLQWGQTPVLTSPPVPPARDIENSSGS